MDQIRITADNETFIKLNCEDHIKAELADNFTFITKNHIYHPLVKARKWDGKIRLYNRITNKMYKGLLPDIREFAKKSNYECIIDPSLDLDEEVSIYEIDKFSKSLKIHSKGNPIETRNYQLEGVTKALRKKRILLLSATSSGKSLMIYLLLRRMLESNPDSKILLLVPTVGLVLQMYDDFNDYSSNNDWSTENNCHKIYEGQDKISNKPIYISTWQSLVDLPKSYFHQFTSIIVDEAHTAQSNSIKYIMENCINSKYRIGTTGSLDGTETNEMVLKGLFGSITKVVTSRELMDRKEAAELIIKCVILNYKESDTKLIHGANYQTEIDYLINNENRNNFICNLGMSLNNNTLIIYQFVHKHGEVLLKKLEELNKDGSKKLYFISGKVDHDIREEIRKIVDVENNAIIVASFGTYQMGVNIPNLHNMIFAFPSKGRIRVIQTIGRGLRLTANKFTVNLFDIVDNLSYNNKPNYGIKHFLERIKIYNSEKFTYKMYNVKLK